MKTDQYNLKDLTYIFEGVFNSIIFESDKTHYYKLKDPYDILYFLNDRIKIYTEAFEEFKYNIKSFLDFNYQNILNKSETEELYNLIITGEWEDFKSLEKIEHEDKVGLHYYVSYPLFKDYEMKLKFFTDRKLAVEYYIKYKENKSYENFPIIYNLELILEFGRLINNPATELIYLNYLKNHKRTFRDIERHQKFISQINNEISLRKSYIDDKKIEEIQLLENNNEVDEKVNHAKKLFFSSKATFDDKRSACETLSYILEPLREELKNYFPESDVNAFFQIVNDFDIRHNKERTKNIRHEEQLEWVFNTLLNSITCYHKMKGKLR